MILCVNRFILKITERIHLMLIKLLRNTELITQAIVQYQVLSIFTEQRLHALIFVVTVYNAALFDLWDLILSQTRYLWKWSRTRPGLKINKEKNVQRKSFTDLQKARRTVPQDHFKRLQESPTPWNQNLKKWGVDQDFWAVLHEVITAFSFSCILFDLHQQCITYFLDFATVD